MEAAPAVAAATEATWLRRDSRMEAAIVRVLALAQETVTRVEESNSRLRRRRTLAREDADTTPSVLERVFACVARSPGGSVLQTRRRSQRQNPGAGSGPPSIARLLRKLPTGSLLKHSLLAEDVRLKWAVEDDCMRVTLPFDKVLIIDIPENFPRMVIQGNALVLVHQAATSVSVTARLADDLYVRGNLVIMTELGPSGDFLDPASVHIPERLSVGGSLMLLNVNVVHWGTDLRVGGDVAVREAGPRLTELPDLAELGGALDCRGCRLLRALPSNLEHAEALMLEDCTSLEHLPDALARVKGDMSLAGCSRLAKLPDYLIVEGNLDLRACSSLTALPSLLTVKGDVWLQDAWSLGKIPVTVDLRGAKIDLRGCISLRRLPVVMLEKKRQRRLLVDVRGTRLDTDFYEVLRSIETDSLKFRFDPAPRVQEYAFASAAGLDDFAEHRLLEPEFLAPTPTPLALDAGTTRAQDGVGHSSAPDGGEPKPRRKTQVLREVVDLDAVETLEDALALFDAEDIDLSPYVDAAYMREVIEFLKLLSSSLESRVPELRKSFLDRLRDVLETALVDEVAREEIFMRMVDAVDTCVDKPVWALGQMQIVAALAHARGDRAALRSLGLGVMRLGVVHKHVEAILASSDLDVDDVCVYLKFELELRDDLDLPVSPRAMEWDQFVQVTSEEIESARDEALAISDADLDAWLAEWTPWQELLRSESLVPYDELEVPAPGTKIDADPAQAVDLLGDAISDPVVVLPDVANIWSYQDVSVHWVRSGLDFSNNSLPQDRFRERVRRLYKKGRPLDAGAFGGDVVATGSRRSKRRSPYAHSSS